MCNLDIDKQILRLWKIETAPKQKTLDYANLRKLEYREIYCDVVWKQEVGQFLFLLNQVFFVKYLVHAFLIVIAGLSESERDIGNDISNGISNIYLVYQIRKTDILGLSRICNKQFP